MDNNHDARLTSSELEKMVFDIHDRLLVIEDKLGLPMSGIERVIVRDIAGRREDQRLAEERRATAYHAAHVEAEKAGHRWPLDVFTPRLNAGEFDATPMPNGR
jgi:hypothetical protein